MCPNPQETADLVTFTEEILDVKLNFLCSVYITVYVAVMLQTSWHTAVTSSLPYIGPRLFHNILNTSSK